jgi:hypothetical protein
LYVQSGVYDSAIPSDKKVVGVFVGHKPSPAQSIDKDLGAGGRNLQVFKYPMVQLSDVRRWGAT